MEEEAGGVEALIRNKRPKVKSQEAGEVDLPSPSQTD